MKDMKEFTSSKIFKLVLGLVAGLVVILLVFAAGIRVGLQKARYSYQWGANYERNFMLPRHGMMDDRREPEAIGGPGGPMEFFGGDGREMRNANGLAGSIVSIKDNLIVLKDRNGKENTVAVSDRTIIKAGRDDIKIGDLKVDERIVIIGNPGDNGVVNADLIRVFDVR